MNAPNFATILDEAPTEVAKPKPLPVGTYLCVVTGAPVFGQSTKKGTPFVEFQLRPVGVYDDVDEDALDEAGGIDGKLLRATYYTTPEAVWRLDEFHLHCLGDLDADSSRRSRCDDVINSEVLVVVRHVPSADNTTVYAEIARTAPKPD